MQVKHDDKAQLFTFPLLHLTPGLMFLWRLFGGLRVCAGGMTIAVNQRIKQASQVCYKIGRMTVVTLTIADIGFRSLLYGLGVFP